MLLRRLLRALPAQSSREAAHWGWVAARIHREGGTFPEKI